MPDQRFLQRQTETKIASTELLQALPVPVYTTDLEGRITFYNEAAAELWGQRPELGSSRWCGSWCLYWPAGRPMPHDLCPMAATIRGEQSDDEPYEAVLERPDGTRVPIIPLPRLLRNDARDGRGALNGLFDLRGRKHADNE